MSSAPDAKAEPTGSTSPTPSPPLRRHRRGLPIRWRLAFISAALTLFILSVFAVAVGELTTSRIRSDFNGQLVTAADELQSRVFVRYDGLSGNLSATKSKLLEDYAAAEHAVIRIVLGDGTPLRTTTRSPVLPVGPGSTTFEVDGYRVVQRRISIDGGGGAYAVVQYARKISDVDATVARVRTFLVVGVIGGSLVALLAGVWLARRAMRPIDVLTRTAQEIARTRDPSQRIPVPHADDEIAELARTLDDMLQGLESSREETEAALARQRQFVADASHELRTPLTSVLVNLELLADVLEGERGEAAQSALRSSRRMRRLVQDLLLLARADARREQPHSPTDLGQVLVEAASELEPAAGEHRLTISARAHTEVNGSRDDLHRLILNLVENAMRHTPPGTEVRASVSIQGDDVLLVVEDNGPGIPPELRERIFERFVRAEGDRGGSFGLGLSIVRAVVLAHDGTVTVEDAAPGARFIVRLPRLPGRTSLLDDPVSGAGYASS